MRQAAFTDTEIEKMAIECSLIGVGPAARRHGIGTSTMYAYRQRFKDSVPRLMTRHQARQYLTEENYWVSRQLGVKPYIIDDLVEQLEINEHLFKQYLSQMGKEHHASDRQHPTDPAPAPGAGKHRHCSQHPLAVEGSRQRNRGAGAMRTDLLINVLHSYAEVEDDPSKQQLFRQAAEQLEELTQNKEPSHEQLHRHPAEHDFQ